MWCTALFCQIWTFGVSQNRGTCTRGKGRYVAHLQFDNSRWQCASVDHQVVNCFVVWIETFWIKWRRVLELVQFFRKVQNESATGSTSSSRIRTKLTINVENIDFDTHACVLRLKGRNIVENPYVKMGAYHTLDLELNRKFLMYKDEWDSVALERIETSCNPTKVRPVPSLLSSFSVWCVDSLRVKFSEFGRCCYNYARRASPHMFD